MKRLRSRVLALAGTCLALACRPETSKSPQGLAQSSPRDTSSGRPGATARIGLVPIQGSKPEGRAVLERFGIVDENVMLVYRETATLGLALPRFAGETLPPRSVVSHGAEAPPLLYRGVTLRQPSKAFQTGLRSPYEVVGNKAVAPIDDLASHKAAQNTSQSIFVSATSDINVAKMYASAENSVIYVLRPNHHDTLIDVNKAYKETSKSNPFVDEQEFAYVGKVHPDSIVGYLKVTKDPGGGQKFEPVVSEKYRGVEDDQLLMEWDEFLAGLAMMHKP